MALIDRIMLNVADLEHSIEFYSGLGFVPGDAGPHHGGRTALMTLGTTRIELVEPYQAGQSYPAARCANDPWFQHFAITVSDMAAAYEQVLLLDHAPISVAGPQVLPPSTGGVTAYKFRDPDGHPLELSFDPSRSRASREGVFLEIGHTAIAVRDLDTSIAWYRDTMAARFAMRLLNRGPEQDRLDGLENVELDIVVLELDAGPHIELLHYAKPASTSQSSERHEFDIAATCTIVAGTERGGTIADPDGHRFRLI